MKKLLYIFLTVLIVACSSDDGNSNNSIVGNWKISDCPRCVFLMKMILMKILLNVS